MCVCVCLWRERGMGLWDIPPLLMGCLRKGTGVAGRAALKAFVFFSLNWPIPTP